MSDTALSRTELVVRTIAQTAVDNETYFCELDAVVGDGDFGYSLARGFEIVLSDWDELELRGSRRPAQEDRARPHQAHRRHLRADLGNRLPARGSDARSTTAEPSGDDVIAALRAAIEGVKQRGHTDLGDKTLLDALVPAVDELEKAMAEGAPDALAARGRHGEGGRRGHQGHARPARAGELHGRAQPRLGRRGRGRRGGDARGREQGLAGGWTRAGLTGSARWGGETIREETR